MNGRHPTDVCQNRISNFVRPNWHLKKNYPRWVLYVMLLFSFPAIVLNIGADIAGMGAVGNLLFPSIDQSYFSVLFTILLLIMFVHFPYQRMASLLKNVW